MAMVYRLQKTFHVLGGSVLSEDIVALLADLVVEGHPLDILHDQVDELVVVVGLVVLDNVRVVERVQRLYLIHQHFHMPLHFRLVEHLDRHAHARIVPISCLVDFAEGADAEQGRVAVDYVILFELLDSLLLELRTVGDLDIALAVTGL